jgi:hypothetical protein
VSLAAQEGLAPADIGHEYRQDDWPSVAAAPDGALWAAWLSFDGSRDDIAIRRFRENKWENLLWVPGTSGDSWSPQVAVDRAGRVWVVWSQQAGGNWDLWARSFDPARQFWSELQRLTSDPLPDISPRVGANRQGQFAVAWQGFRGKHSNIFLKHFDGERWSEEVGVTRTAANDWDPAVALDERGTAWVAWDSYRNGNYDVFLAQVEPGRPAGREIPVATTARFEARASVAVDTGGGVWVAWETRLPNWGKDQGYIIRNRQTGALLVTADTIRVRRYQNGQWQEPKAPLAEAIPGIKPYAPQVFSDGRGSVWVVAYPRKKVGTPHTPKDGYTPSMERGTWEFRATHLDGDRWSETVLLPESGGRLSLRAAAVTDASGNFWAVWPTDSRNPAYLGRPIRQRVWAAKVSGPPAPGSLSLGPPREDPIEVKPGHRDEPGDLRAIRPTARTWRDGPCASCAATFTGTPS